MTIEIVLGALITLICARLAWMKPAHQSWGSYACELAEEAWTTFWTMGVLVAFVAAIAFALAMPVAKP